MLEVWIIVQPAAAGAGGDKYISVIESVYDGSAYTGVVLLCKECAECRNIHTRGKERRGPEVDFRCSVKVDEIPVKGLTPEKRYNFE